MTSKTATPVHDMASTWRDRLIEAIDASELSDRELCRRAGVGSSFVSDLKNMAKEPSAANVLKLAKALNLSLTFLFTGADLDLELEEVLKVYAALPPNRRAALIALLREQRASESA